jgi:hypothetical protein
VPTCEVRGEGIFIQFKQSALQTWLQRPGVLEQSDTFDRAHSQWRAARGLGPAMNRPDVAYVLLHSFAHALIRQFTLECGYAAASIRERIYWSSSDGGAEERTSCERSNTYLDRAVLVPTLQMADRSFFPEQV